MRIESEYAIVTGIKDKDSGLYDVKVDHKHVDYPMQLDGVTLSETKPCKTYIRHLGP